MSGRIGKNILTDHRPALLAYYLNDDRCRGYFRVVFWRREIVVITLKGLIIKVNKKKKYNVYFLITLVKLD